MDHRRMRWAGVVLAGAAFIAAAAVVTPHTSASADGAQPEPVVDAPAPVRAAALPAQSGSDAVAQARFDGRPNIVMILVDDMALGDLATMPNVKRLLGAAGTTFTRTLSPYPLCCPGRATLLTGQYAHNHKVMGNQQPLGGFYALRDRRTLPVWLQAAGYRTIMMGKYLNQYQERPRYVPPGWSDWSGLNANAYTYTDVRINLNGIPHRERATYQTDYLTELALDRIDTSAPSADPYFMWVSYVAPHNGGPRTDSTAGEVSSPYVAPEHQDEFAGVPQPRTRSFNEADVSDKPANVASQPKMDPADMNELWQQRQEAMQSVDTAVAQLIGRLEETGELDNTIVAFTSDNGYLVGEHRMEGKILPYEESVRVPLLIRGPGFPAGLKVAQQSSLADLAPTFARAAKARPNLQVDGVALQQLVTDPAAFRHRPIVVEAAPNKDMLLHGAPMDRMHRSYVGVRTASNELYVEYANGEREYYDMRTDPYQLRNRYGAPGAHDDVRRLARLLDRIKNCSGPACSRTWR